MVRTRARREGFAGCARAFRDKFSRIVRAEQPQPGADAESPELREMTAAQALAKQADRPEVREALMSLLGDHEWDVRRAAADALAEAADNPEGARHLVRLVASKKGGDARKNPWFPKIFPLWPRDFVLWPDPKGSTTARTSL